MSTSFSRWIAAGLVTLSVTTACSAANGGGSDPAPSPGAGSTEGVESLFWARLDSASTRYSEADARFMTDMIAHHAQAVAMSHLAPDRAESAGVRTLAARIINAQQDEITLMQAWLRDRGEPVPDGTGAAHGHGEVPGMLTPEQMSRLEEASGAQFDRLFLTYMIEHHRGAVLMVRELFATDGAGQDPTVFKFASDVQVDQTTEIARMERMLAELSATRPPPGGRR